MKRIKVVQTENELPTEVIAQAIIDIDLSIKKILSGRLNEKAIYLLIQNSSTSPYRNGTKVGITEVKAVIQGIASLRESFLKKEPK